MCVTSGKIIFTKIISVEVMDNYRNAMRINMFIFIWAIILRLHMVMLHYMIKIIKGVIAE